MQYEVQVVDAGELPEGAPVVMVEREGELPLLLISAGLPTGRLLEQRGHPQIGRLGAA